MDGDALIIPQKRLMWILENIKEHLPWVKRVGAYANTKSIKMKSLDDLVKLTTTLEDKIKEHSATLHKINGRLELLEISDRLPVMIIDGVNGIQEGRNPRVIEGMLMTYLPGSERGMDDEDAEAAPAG